MWKDATGKEVNSDCPFCGKPDQENVCQRCGTAFGMERQSNATPAARAYLSGFPRPATKAEDARDELIRNNFSPIETRGRTVKGCDL